MLYDVLKSFIQILFPFPLSLLIISAGVVLLWRTKSLSLGRTMVTAGTLWLLLCSAPPISDPVVRFMENRFLHVEYTSTGIPSNIAFVVVLGGSHQDNRELPITSRINAGGLTRAIEGGRVYRRLHGAKLLLSGGMTRKGTCDAQMMCKLATDLGVPRKDIVLEEQSRNTAEQAHNERFEKRPGFPIL